MKETQERITDLLREQYGLPPVAAPSPPPAPERMSNEEFAELCDAVDSLLEEEYSVPMIAACRRARESEKEWKGHYTDLAELLEGRDAEIAALQRHLAQADADLDESNREIAALKARIEKPEGR
jgi:septal ring factor EnvC (AmiA/AmiB activator)